MKFELSKKTQSLLDQVTEFINKEIIPNESLYEQQVEEGGRWCVPPIIEEMKEKAKKAGLWNLFLPESDLGAGLTNFCLLYTSPSPRDQRGSRMPSSA